MFAPVTEDDFSGVEGSPSNNVFFALFTSPSAFTKAFNMASADNFKLAISGRDDKFLNAVDIPRSSIRFCSSPLTADGSAMASAFLGGVVVPDVVSLLSSLAFFEFDAELLVLFLCLGAALFACAVWSSLALATLDFAAG